MLAETLRSKQNACCIFRCSERMNLPWKLVKALQGEVIVIYGDPIMNLLDVRECYKSNSHVYGAARFEKQNLQHWIEGRDSPQRYHNRIERLTCSKGETVRSSTKSQHTVCFRPDLSRAKARLWFESTIRFNEESRSAFIIRMQLSLMMMF